MKKKGWIKQRWVGASGIEFVASSSHHLGRVDDEIHAHEARVCPPLPEVAIRDWVSRFEEGGRR